MSSARKTRVMGDEEALELFGTTQSVASTITLSAGPLSCDLSEGGLRSIRWGDVEIVRAISYLLRDRDWGTVPAITSDPEVSASANSFDARFEMRMATPDGALACSARLRGDAEGQLLFEVTATPDVPLATNRCGFVVLHPASAAGSPLRVEHTDGRMEDTAFPRLISPSQPVLDIRGLRYAPVAGVDLELRLEADLPGDPAGKFEMEDQRNWSDASFKTYVASLLDPWPYTLPGRRGLRQSVLVNVKGQAPRRAGAAASSRKTLRLGEPSPRVLPAIGVGVPPGISRARQVEIAALRALGARWWLVELDLQDPGLSADLLAVAAARHGINAEVQIDVIAPADMAAEDAASTLRRSCREAGLAINAVRMLPAPLLKSFQPSDRWPAHPALEDYAIAARRHFPRALVGGGMFTSFTELNRKRPSAEGLDFIGHLTCPIVHAADDQSVMQTVEALPHITASVRGIWPKLAYRLGPSCLAPRRNPYGEDTAPNPRHERIALASSDPRHAGRFGAAWTVAYAACCAGEGLDVLAMHESHGPNGPCGGEPLVASSAERSVVPAWQALQVLASAQGARLVPIADLPSDAAGLAWTRDGSHFDLLVANTGPTTIDFELPDSFETAGLNSSTALGPYMVRHWQSSRTKR